jgi:hypothetical protein
MVWLPTLNVLMLRDPLPAARVAVPIAVVPSWKVTVPLGDDDPEAGATVAVSVMACPAVAVAADATSVVAVASCTEELTWITKGLEVEAASVLFPA